MDTLSLSQSNDKNADATGASKINATAVLFPIAISCWLWPLSATNFIWQLAIRLAGLFLSLWRNLVIVCVGFLAYHLHSFSKDEF